jgi:hypothetical protein
MAYGAWWVSNALLVAVLALACSDDDPRDAGNGGSGGQSATDGGGSGGTVGATAGSGGSGGAATGGAAGSSSGTGGASGSVGAPCSPEPVISEDELARAVVALNSCLSDDGYYRTQTYLRGKVGGYSYIGGSCFTDCLAQITTGCAGVRACFGLSDIEPGDPCNSCQGNVAIVCGSDLEVRWDCSKYGGTCSAGRCIPAGRGLCEESSFDDNCDAEGRPLHCDDGLQVGPRCADFGLECRQDTFAAHCVGTGAACSAPEFPYFDVHYVGRDCNAGRLSACVRGGLADLDCSSFGSDFTCQSSGGEFFCGIASECDPATHVKSCEGTVSVMCNAGKLMRVDCAALGFAACSANARIACE